MAPGLVDNTLQEEVSISSKTTKTAKPLQLSDALDQFESFDVTPIIGTEYPTVNVVDLLNAPNSDELIRDLAIKSNRICCM